MHLSGPGWSVSWVYPWGHSLRCAVRLLWGPDLRLWNSCQISIFQDPRKRCLATGSLLTVWWKMRCLGPRLQHPLAFWLWLPHTCPSASRERGTYIAVGFLSSDIHSILCSESAPGVTMWYYSLSHKCLSLSLSLWRSHGLVYYLTLAPSDFPQDIQAWSSPKGPMMMMQLTPPCQPPLTAGGREHLCYLSISDFSCG